MFKLYELTEMYRNIYELLSDESTDQEALEKALGEIKDNIDVKAENTVKVIKEIEGNIETLRTEEKRLAKRRRTLDNNVKSLKGYLESQLQAMDIDKVEGDLFTVALQNNPPSVKFTDEDLIPEKYKEVVTSVKIPKRAILEAINAGEEVTGAEVVQTRSLRIR